MFSSQPRVFPPCQPLHQLANAMLAVCASILIFTSTPSWAQAVAPSTHSANDTLSKLLAKGYQALKDGRLDEAQAQLQQAYQINPNDQYVLLNLGVLAQKQQQNETAKKLYQRVIALSKQYPGVGLSAQANKAEAVEQSPAQLAEKNLAQIK